MVCFIHRPEYYKIYTSADGTDLRGMAEIIIAKHRNGAVGDVRLRFIGQYTRFQNPEDDMVIPPPTEGMGGATFGSRMNAPIGSPLHHRLRLPPTICLKRTIRLAGWDWTGLYRFNGIGQLT